MNIDRIDLSEADRAAFATSYYDDIPRWVELSVFYRADLPQRARRWVAEVSRFSCVAGEVTKRRRLASASLDRALSLFEDSDLTRIVCAEALDWAEANAAPIWAIDRKPPSDLRGALAWLMGQDPEQVDVAAAADGLNIPSSRLLLALASGEATPNSLSSLLPFVDRAGFQARVAYLQNARG